MGGWGIGVDVKRAHVAVAVPWHDGAVTKKGLLFFRKEHLALTA
jgi:hypothetical protein